MRRRRTPHFNRPHKGGATWIGRLMFLVVFVYIASQWFGDKDSNTTPSSPRGGPPVAGAPVVETLSDAQRDEILASLRAPAPAKQADGVAVAVVVDTSGSMQQSVAGGDGRKVGKMDAARQAVRELVMQTQAIAQQRSDRPILLGLYEFSDRGRGEPLVRQLTPFAPPDVAAVTAAVQRMRADGGTPIGEAIVAAKRDLDATGLSRQHVLVVTDGQNTFGPPPGAVVKLLYDPQHDLNPVGVHFVAFDVAASVFEPVKQAGGTVLSASDAPQLRQTLEQVMTERILVE